MVASLASASKVTMKGKSKISECLSIIKYLEMGKGGIYPRIYFYTQMDWFWWAPRPPHADSARVAGHQAMRFFPVLSHEYFSAMVALPTLCKNKC